MANFKEVEEKLAGTLWSEASKDSLLLVIPRLGRWALSFLNQQINSIGSEYLSDQIAEIISQEPQWYVDIQKNNIDHIIQKVKAVVAGGDVIEQKALLAVILDIRYNPTVADLVVPQLAGQFDNIVIRHLKDVPYKEVAALLGHRINNLVGVPEATMEIKRYCYYRDCLYSDEPEIIAFKEALENNHQLIGSEPKAVKDWIDDFLRSASTSTDRSAYNVAYYITNSPLTKNLSEIERRALSEILKLYNWVLQPYATEKEIEHYEEQRFAPSPVPVAAPAVNQAEVPHVVLKQSAPITYSQPAPPAPASSTQRSHTPAPVPSVSTGSHTTPEQRRILEEISRSKHHGTYNGGNAEDSSALSSADAAKIHDLINHKLNNQANKRGVTMDPTNVKMEEEKKRIEEERASRIASIQTKLTDLRKRSKKTK